MEFYAHAEGIGENTEKDESLKPVVIDKKFHVGLEHGKVLQGGAAHVPIRFPRRDGKLICVSQMIYAFFHILIYGLGKIIRRTVFQVLRIERQLSCQSG